MEKRAPLTNQPSNFQPSRFGTRQSQAQPGLFQRLQQGWFHLSSPAPERFGTGIQDQERLRRAQLLSSLLILIPFGILLSVPTALDVPSLWWTLVTCLLIGIGAAYFNRRGYVTGAGLLYIAAIDISVLVLMVTQPHGITNSNISDFDLFIIPVLIGGLVLRRQFLPFVALAHISLIITLFGMLPHDPLFLLEIKIHQNGSAYGELTDAFLLQVCAGLVAWLGANSVDRALLRASHAEELAQAQMHIDQQTRQITTQKQRLEQGIIVLKEALSRVANGDYTTRACLQNNELFPLAISFNLMMERLERSAGFEQAYHRLEQALQALQEMRIKLVRGEHPCTLHTGTRVDQFVPLLERHYHHLHCMIQGHTYIEELHVAIQLQQSHLTLLETSLARFTALIHNTHAQMDAASPRKQPSAPLFPYLARDSQLAEDARTRWHNALEGQLLEETSQLCTQARETNTHAMQKIRALSQLLSVDYA